MARVDLLVPDLGGFDDVPVISVLVKAGDVIGKDAPLIELESDKATMEVPATAAGTIADIKVKVGDKVSQGTVIASVESADATIAVAATPTAATPSAPDQSVILSQPALSRVEGKDGPASPSAPAAPIAVGDEVIALTVPDIGGFTDVPIVSVFVKAGDTIEANAPLVEIESDKATMEVPATSGGVIRDVRLNVGDKVSQGSVIATLARTGSAGAPAPTVAAPVAPPVTPQSLTPTVQSPNTSPTSAPVVSAHPPAGTPSANGASRNGSAAHGPVHGSPAIRRFARELGADLTKILGSGPNGRITRDDVQNFVKRSLAVTGGGTTPAATGAGLGLLPWPKVDFAKYGPIERVPLTRIQKLSGPNLARNWVMIPHVTQNEDADVTELETFRKQINAEQKDAKVTMLAFLIKASVAALKAFPNFNSSLDGDELVRKNYWHIGFAADTPGGLVVPVVRDADKKGLLEIAREMGALAAKARDGKLGMADMTGATFTISSLGGIGGTYFTPIINAPEVAILGACRSASKPVWDGAAFAPRTILPLSLSYDHRVIDGASAARFATFLAAVLADMRRTLL
jgi:pyruvate dehydrogenase E2 component (dihydrolipoamide acetyltransferase)